MKKRKGKIMGNNLKKVLVFLFCLSLVIGLMGCGGSSSGKIDGSDDSTPKAAENKASGGSAETESSADGPVEFTFWYPLGQNVLGNMKQYGENEVFQWAGEKLGVNVTFLHPVQGTEQEAFSLFFASDNLPDFIYTGGNLMYVDGPESAVEDGYFLDLTDLANEYCPNYMAVVNSSDDLKKLTVTDNGIRWCFNFIYEKGRKGNFGPVIRKDFLDAVGETVPVTYDDWTRVLTKFKNDLNIESPVYIQYGDGDYSLNDWTAGFYTAKDFFAKDGKTVTFGPLEDGYKDYLDLLSGWYKDGLLDQNFSIRNSSMPDDDLVFNDKIGGWVSYASWTGTEYYPSRGATNPDFNLVAAPIPAKKAGDERHLRNEDLQINAMQIAVSAKCKNIPKALEWMDFFYGKEGAQAMNYGLHEGKTYDVQPDGSLKWGEYITANPDGMTMTEARGYYTSNNAFYENYNRVSDTWKDVQKESQQTWVASKDDWVMPRGVNMTAEENQEFSSIMTEIRTYVVEETVKTIMGISSTSFDDFRNQIRSMGIERATEIYQTALNRYLNR